MLIESLKNPKIKQTIALKEKKERDKTGLFVLEGERLVSEIPEDLKVEYYILSETCYNKGSYINLLKRNHDVLILNDNLFKKVSDTVSPQGILAVCRQYCYDFDFVFDKKSSFILMLENISDPGNMGTIIRTADAFGADMVLLNKGCVDLYNNKVIRATMGSIFHIPVIRNADFDEIFYKLKDKGISTIAAHLEAKKEPFNIDLKKNCAILIGNEANGLSVNTSKRADILVKIPMKGQAESINASIAGSILMYEVLRQRN